jgi:MHS family alpha-ketoglutarate permease-like MFS transporter
VGRRPQLLVCSAAIALLVVPLSTLVRPGLGGLMVLHCTGLGLYALMTSIAPAVMSEVFPTEVRAIGMGSWYNLTVATFGGTGPLVIQALSSAGRQQAFSWYVAAGAVVCFLTVLSMRETAGTELRVRAAGQGQRRARRSESAYPSPLVPPERVAVTTTRMLRVPTGRSRAPSAAADR